MKNWSIVLSAMIAICVFAVFCVWIPILLWRNPLSIESFVELGDMFLSWPVLVTVVALFVLCRYSEAIDVFLRNIRRVSFPGGNVQTQDPGFTGTASSDASAPGSISLTPEQQWQVQQYIKELSVSASARNLDHEKQLKETLSNSLGWKFSYLNLFYVLLTKHVLF